MTEDEKRRIQGVLVALSKTFSWEMKYSPPTWEAYMAILDDLEFEEVKDAIIYISKRSQAFLDPVQIRNFILFERKMRLAVLAAQ